MKCSVEAYLRCPDHFGSMLSPTIFNPGTFLKSTPTINMPKSWKLEVQLGIFLKFLYIRQI